MRNSSGGEIVEVEGGHIVRSTGRKDRHSKVCTAKGPRDRRVRLAAHTAIQFYDVQDRLGYDRPSKAVDWLIKKAKAAIDELAQLPAWHPTSALHDHEEERRRHQFGVIANTTVQHRSRNADAQNSSFLPPSLDSDAIADTVKSFFPAGGEASSAAMQFHSFPAPDLVSRNSGSSSQDLRLSLQSFQDPTLIHHHNEQPQPQPQPQTQVLLSGTPLGLDGWPEHQRLAAWNGGGAGYFPQPMLQQLLGQNQFVSQRGPLQSSNTPSICAWMDPSAIAIDHPPINSSSSIGFASGVGGFSGFYIPARIQGDEEERDKPSSASSDSRH